MDFSLNDTDFPVNYFTSRNGGKSVGAYQSLNFGLLTGDEQELVRENFALYRKHRRFALPIITVRQVHGTEIITVLQEGESIRAKIGDTAIAVSFSADFHLFDLEGDAIYTEEKGLPIGIYTADCLPVLISDLQKSFVMAIHCGWRGTVDGILERALQFLAERSKADLTILLGPAIDSCCFEMGAEHLHRFSDTSVMQRDNTHYIDLKNEVRSRLENSPVTIRRVESINHCTCCNPDLFFSYRRESITGRHLNIACL